MIGNHSLAKHSRVAMFVAMCVLMIPDGVAAQDHSDGGGEGGGDDGSACHWELPCLIGGVGGDLLAQGPVGDKTPEPTFFHRNCLYCERSVCHESCEPEDDEDSDFAAAYAELMRAVRDGDPRKVMDVAPYLSEYVTWNARRNAIQVLSCNRKDLIASLEVGPEMAMAVASTIHRLRNDRISVADGGR